MTDDRPSGPVETPDVPEHIHTINETSGQITIPIEIRERFDTDKFCVFTDPDDDQIHLHPVRTK